MRVHYGIFYCSPYFVEKLECLNTVMIDEQLVRALLLITRKLLFISVKYNQEKNLPNMTSESRLT